MKNIIFISMISGALFSTGVSAQTIKDNINKLEKDKSTRERADKADVLIQKKIIYDSTQTKPPTVKSDWQVTTKSKHKKQMHKKKRKVKLRK